MKCLKWIALTALSLSCISANAGNIPATTIYDNYIGAGFDPSDSTPDVKGRMNHWDTDRMVVSRTGSTMTVDIITSFYNDITRSGIVLGDLFMSTIVGANGTPWNPNTSLSNYAGDRYSSVGNTTGTNWNYAYNINDNDRDNINNYGSQNVSGGGNGQLVSGFNNSNLVLSNSTSNRHNQGVYLNSNGNYTSHNEPSSTDGWTNNGYLETDGSWYGTISFTFDVSGTDLMHANQIAFRWAMSCANDIIEGLVAVKDSDTTPVPEPQTLLLMLLAMAGIAYKRKA